MIKNSPALSGREREGSKFFLSLLLLDCPQLKIILKPEWYILGQQAPNPFRDILRKEVMVKILCVREEQSYHLRVWSRLCHRQEAGKLPLEFILTTPNPKSLHCHDLWIYRALGLIIFIPAALLFEDWFIQEEEGSRPRLGSHRTLYLTCCARKTCPFDSGSPVPLESCSRHSETGPLLPSAAGGGHCTLPGALPFLEATTLFWETESTRTKWC